MRISMVIHEKAKQIMLTPETEHEKEALKHIGLGDKLEIVSKWGSFGDESHANLQVKECQGKYLRVFSEADSLMFVIKKQDNN